MKLRQKSYLLSTLLVTGALFLCASILLLPSIRATVRSVEARAFGEEKALAMALDSLLTSTVPEDREPEDYTELQNRMDEYLDEFEKNGLNAVNVEL